MTQTNPNRYIVWNLEKTDAIVTPSKRNTECMLDQYWPLEDGDIYTDHASEFVDEYGTDCIFVETFNPDNHFRMVLPHNFGSAIVQTQDDGKFAVWIETGPTHGDGYYVQKDIDNFVVAVWLITNDVLKSISDQIAGLDTRPHTADMLARSRDKFYRNVISGKFKLPGSSET